MSPLTLPLLFALFSAPLAASAQNAPGAPAPPPPPPPAPAVQLPAKPDLHLFILAGQSNMAGRGKLDEAATTPHPRVFALRRDLQWAPAVDPLHWDKSSAGTGIGKPFAEALAAAFPSTSIGLIPTACGGSPVSAWQPGQFFSQTKSHPWDDCMTRTKRALQDGTLKAILWHQGESDANPKDAAAYEQRLEELIVRFRTELNAPDLPFLIGQLGRFPAKPWSPATESVDAAHRSLAARLKNVRFIPISEPASIGDHLHFDTASLRIFAKGYAEAYLDLVKSPAR